VVETIKNGRLGLRAAELLQAKVRERGLGPATKRTSVATHLKKLTTVNNVFIVSVIV